MYTERWFFIHLNISLVILTFKQNRHITSVYMRTSKRVNTYITASSTNQLNHPHHAVMVHNTFHEFYCVRILFVTKLKMFISPNHAKPLLACAYYRGIYCVWQIYFNSSCLNR